MTSLEERQKMVSLSEQGYNSPQIAQQIGCSVWTVRKWLQRYKKGAF